MFFFFKISLSPTTLYNNILSNFVVLCLRYPELLKRPEVANNSHLSRHWTYALKRLEQQILWSNFGQYPLQLYRQPLLKTFKQVFPPASTQLFASNLRISTFDSDRLSAISSGTDFISGNSVRKGEQSIASSGTV